MIEINRDLIEIYCFAFATGLGLYQLAFPNFLKRRVLAATLIPGVGLAQLAIVASYCIGLNIPINRALIVTALTGSATLIAALMVKRPRARPLRFYALAMHVVKRRNLALACAGSVLSIGTLFAVLWPTVHAGMATTPYRIGIDQVGYAESAQVLLEGESLASMRSRLLSELDTAQLRLAQQQNYKDLHFETYVDAEFLLKATRWGYPGALAALTILTANGHVYRLAFLLLIFGYALSLSIVYYIARYAMRLPSIFSSLIALTVAFNCNMLNVYYEGQYAQTFAEPYLLAILAIYLRVRTPTLNAEGKKRTFITTISTVALLTAALFCAFNESLVVLFAIVAITTLLDFLFFRSTNVAALLIMCCGFALGTAIAWPLSYSWITYTVANLSDLGHAGFWQPHWAALSEIVGLRDMYVSTGSKLVPRSDWDEYLNVALSVMVASIILRLFLRTRTMDRTFWMVPLILISAEYAKSRYIDDILNYPYMKLYTILLPLLAVLAFTAIYRFSIASAPIIGYAKYAAVLAVLAVGWQYIGRYVSQSSFVTRDMFALYRFSGERRFDNYAILTNHADIEQYMYVPLISMRWVNEIALQKYMRHDSAKRVLMIVRNADVPCRRCATSFFAGKVIYEDPTQFFVDTRLSVAELCDPAIRFRQVAELGYDGQKQWVDGRLPDGAFSYRQCDFSYATELLARSSRPEY